MYKTFGETIASLRRAHGMRQQTLADALAEAGVPVSNQAVSKWENDATLPNAQQFLTLCRVLDVDDIAGTFSGGDAGGLLAGLNAEGRRRALEYIALLRESKRFAAAPEPAVLRSLPLYSLAVSAGTGQFLDGESYEMQPVGPEVPEEANFGVRVAGDSMEPRFHSGQTVWVHQQPTLDPGEIGVFLYDGSAYLKQLRNAGIDLALVHADGLVPLPITLRRGLRLSRLHAVQLRERIEQRRADKLAQARRVRLADAEALERILHAAQDALAGVKQRAVKIK